MSKYANFKFLSLFVVLVTLVLPRLRQPVKAQKDPAVTDPLTHPFFSLGDRIPEPLDSFIPQIWVTRVYFSSRQQVDNISTWIEPWEVNYKDGYLVVGVSQTDYNRLKMQGLQVEIDHRYTQRVQPSTGKPAGPGFRYPGISPAIALWKKPIPLHKRLFPTIHPWRLGSILATLGRRSPLAARRVTI